MLNNNIDVFDYSINIIKILKKVYILLSIIMLSVLFTSCLIQTNIDLYPMADTNGLWGYIKKVGSGLLMPSM